MTELLRRLSIAGSADAWLLKGVVDDRRRIAVPLERPSLRNLRDERFALERMCAHGGGAAQGSPDGT